jgi:hypothetical protein
MSLLYIAKRLSLGMPTKVAKHDTKLPITYRKSAMFFSHNMRLMKPKK